MKICKIKPERHFCRDCISIQSMCSVMDDCDRCSVDYELITVGTDVILGDYAMILTNENTIIRVSLSRVYDVRERR